MRRVAVACLVLVGMFALAPRAQAAPILYGITFDEELIRINTTTGAGALVGPLSTAMDAYGLATWGSRLIAFDQNTDLLRELNPNTGATIGSISVGTNLVGEGGFAMRSDGTGFIADCAEGDLYSFNANTNSSALVGNSGSGVCFDGLDISAGGTLYGLSQGFVALYTINQVTGAATFVGNTGFGGGSGLSGLAFAPDGTLFAADQTSNLYIINLATGAASLVGATGFNNISGLTFLDDAAAVPEPATLLLLGGGLVGGLARRRRRKN